MTTRPDDLHIQIPLGEALDAQTVALGLCALVAMLERLGATVADLDEGLALTVASFVRQCVKPEMVGPFLDAFQADVRAALARPWPDAPEGRPQ